MYTILMSRYTTPCKVTKTHRVLQNNWGNVIKTEPPFCCRPFFSVRLVVGRVLRKVIIHRFTFRLLFP